MELETAPPAASEHPCAPSADMMHGAVGAGDSAPTDSDTATPAPVASAAPDEQEGHGETETEADPPESARFLESLKRRLDAGSSGEGHSDMARKSKRNKLLIPSDREAYYAVLSLLVDRADIPAGTRLTAANCEGFVPSEDRLLLDVLQKVLRYDCE